MVIYNDFLIDSVFLMMMITGVQGIPKVEEAHTH